MPPKKETILKEIQRGEKSLKAAQILCKNGLYEDAVSRAYYAVMIDLDQDRAEERILQAEQFVSTVKKFLMNLQEN